MLFSLPRRRIPAQTGERLQRIFRAGQRADEHRRTGEQHDDADAFPETLPAFACGGNGSSACR
jgi:hypothetical protein